MNIACPSLVLEELYIRQWRTYRNLTSSQSSLDLAVQKTTAPTGAEFSQLLNAGENNLALRKQNGLFYGNFLASIARYII